MYPEERIVDPLSDTLSPLTIASLPDEEVRDLAADSAEATEQRSELEARSTLLEEGREAFRVAMGVLR